jgi:hypothetical protein
LRSAGIGIAGKECSRSVRRRGSEFNHGIGIIEARKHKLQAQNTQLINSYGTIDRFAFSSRIEGGEATPA